jgi:hypothetical protein
VARKYNYTHHITDPDNFIYHYIAYASKRTDASWDYHEAMALSLLATATYGLRMEMPHVPDGLKTNLYLILFGPSTFSRKSTSMDIAKDIQVNAIPTASLPANFSPGGFEEEVAIRSNQPSLLLVDEFSGILEKIHHQKHMAGLAEFIMTMYKESEWQYSRTSKGGKEKSRDIVVISGAHLTIVGNATPTVMYRINEVDVESGFLARFAVIAPDARPERIPIYKLPPLDKVERAWLIDRLIDLHSACLSMTDANKHVIYKTEVLRACDKFQSEVEQHDVPEHTKIMLQRIPMMALKIAMIIAAGGADPAKLKKLHVTIDDINAAIGICRKFARWANLFSRETSKNRFEHHIDKVMRMLEESKKVSRSKIARTLRLNARELNDVQSTLIDRGMIIIQEFKPEGAKKPTLVYILNDPEISEDVSIPISL